MQSRNKFGAPLTLGVKIIPKVTNVLKNGQQQKDMVKGFDMIIHSELWLCNLTSLPITFGAPSSQFYSKRKDKPYSRNGMKNIPSILNAENALLELSSILEFGDKGHSFSNDNDESYDGGEVLVIPNQKNSEEIGKMVHISIVLNLQINL